MTTYGAYNQGLPCRNSSCKSHGKPHPNCQCYGGMAAGGEVEHNGSKEGGGIEHYCSKDRPHVSSCEYFAQGGSVHPDIDEKVVKKLSVTPLHTDDTADMAHAVASAGAPGLFKGIKDHDSYQRHVKRGASQMDRKVNDLFMGSKVDHDVDDKQREKVKKYMEGGGLHQNIQASLHGTDSSDPMLQPAAEATPLATSHPAKNMGLQMTRGRVADYLNSLRPGLGGPKLAFDDDMEDPEKQRSYERAINLAVSPLSILGHVSGGTTEPEHIKHLNSMYPEVNDQLQKKLTEKIIEAQLDKKKPSFKVRQGLSMLMGTPLSGEFTPGSITAAQGTFSPSQPQAPPGGGGGKKSKGSKSSLTKSDESFLTQSQARQERQQKV